MLYLGRNLGKKLKVYVWFPGRFGLHICYTFTERTKAEGSDWVTSLSFFLSGNPVADVCPSLSRTLQALYVFDLGNERIDTFYV